MNRVYAFLVGILAAVGAMFGIYRKGHKAGKVETEHKAQQRDLELANERKKIERDVVSSGDSVDRLRDNWTRD